MKYKKSKNLPIQKLVTLYNSVGWKQAKHPDLLKKAIKNSDYVISAWDNDKLIGLGRAITDWSFAVYICDVLVLKEYQNKRIGREITKRLMEPFKNFHNQVVMTEEESKEFYKKFGFTSSKDVFIIIKDIK